jgi:hypothetical protein
MIAILMSNVELFRDSIREFTVSDDPWQLLGPEIMVAQHREESTLYAFAYRHVYNKKVELKYFAFSFMGLQM